MAITTATTRRDTMLRDFPGIAERLSPKPVFSSQKPNTSEIQALHQPVELEDLHSAVFGSFGKVMAAVEKPEQFAKLIATNRNDIESHLSPHGYNAYELIAKSVLYPESLKQIILLKPGLVKEYIISGEEDGVSGLAYHARNTADSLKQLIKLDPDAVRKEALKVHDFVQGTKQFKASMLDMVEDTDSKKLLEALIKNQAS